MVIPEEEARIVRRICREFLNGQSVTRFAEGPERDEIHMDQGSKGWSLGTIRKILPNEPVKDAFFIPEDLQQGPADEEEGEEQGKLRKYCLMDSHPGVIGREARECVPPEIRRQGRTAGSIASRSTTATRKRTR
jgi:site-specific DNA recombinase